MNKKQGDNCGKIIVASATAAAGIGWAPIPGSDMVPILGVQAAMVCGLADVFDIPMTTAVAKSIAKAFFVGNAGKMLVGQALKLFPILGSAANAAVAFFLTYQFGWHMANYLDKNAVKLKNGDFLEDLQDILTNVSGGKFKLK